MIKEETEYLSETESMLATGAINKLFRRFAIPGVVGLLFLGIQTVIDGIMLGNFVGSNALASVGLVLPCYSFIAAVSVIIGIGCQTLVSINLGRQDRAGANNALTSGFIAIAFFTTLFAILLFVFAPHIPQLLGANTVLASDSVAYLRALSPFFPIIGVMFFSDYILKSMGHPIYSMVIMSGTVIANILLDLLFIVVFEMGVTGAGFATGLAFLLGSLCSLPIIFNRNNLISVQSGRFNMKLVWQMLYNGSSEGVSEFSSGISVIMFNIVIMKYLGENGVAAFVAINYVFFIGITVFLGISDGIIPIISYNYGANRWDRIKEALKLAFKTNLIIGITLFVLLMFFGEYLISIFFNSNDTEVLQLAINGAHIYAFAFLLNGFNILSTSYFTAMSNAKISIIISLCRGLVFVAICIWLLPEIFGVGGIWVAVPIAELLTFAVSVFLVRRSLKANL